MDVYALDKDFNLISTGIPFINLQWNRKYYEAGDFQLEIPMRIYDVSWKYIGTNDRPELGMIQKIEEYGEGDVNALISGFFCEKMLDDKVCYPRYTGTATKTETAVRNIFAKYKKDLPIELGPANNPLLGDSTQSDFADDELGRKLFSILESRECSLRVEYDFVNNRLRLKVWQGLNRTQSQSVNPYQVFSSEFGNIVNKSIDMDESGYKNYAIIPCNEDDNGKEKNTYYLDWTNGGYRKEIVFDRRSSKPEEGQSMADFQNAILQEAAEKLITYAKVEDINVEQAGNVGYMTDFDLGDKCDMILTDIGIQMETRIVEVQEVFKANGGHTVSLGLGNKRIDNIRRAANSI